MKKKIMLAALALTLMGGVATTSYAQDTKSNKKERKAMKKADKGKVHKALKKDKKSDDKAELGR